MASSGGNKQQQSATDRRRNELALSDFADYVDKQQVVRQQNAAAAITGLQTAPAPSSGGNAKPSAQPAPQPELDEDELNFIESLGLDDAPKQVSLKDQLLGNADGLDNVLLARFQEGRGETLFDIGFENNGEPIQLTKAEYDVALETLKATAKKLGAESTVLLFDEKNCSAKVMIRLVPKSIEELLEIRVAVVGNVDAGKSTMLGVLVKGQLDDGRGRARVNLFRHKHEIESGRTSSVGMEIMGYDANSQIVNSGTERKLSWEDIGKRSAKVISFTDLAGHERYLRTTVFGLLGTSPDYCLLMVAANNGLIGMSKEHLGIAVALNVPVMVVITKIDMTPPNVLQQTITQLTKILKSAGSRKIPIFIKSQEEVISTATHFVSDRICPIFQVSNVTGEGLDFVRTFLNVLPYHGKFDSNGPFEYHVNDTFSVPFVGTVVSGVVKSGIIHAGDPILIGPDSLGNFISTNIRSIERKRIAVHAVHAGQSASFALKKVRRRDVRKGMVVLPKSEVPPKAYREFVAEVLILSHSTTIKQKYQAMLHVGPVSQTCSIIDLDRDAVRTGDRATVAFHFVQRPEYIVPGDKLIFREGRTKGLGVIKEVGYDPINRPLNPNKATENGSSTTTSNEKDKSKEKAAKHQKTASEKMEYKKGGVGGGDSKQQQPPASPTHTRQKSHGTNKHDRNASVT